MDFTEHDRKLITEHDVKLSSLCLSIKTLNKDMKDGFKTIFDKLDKSTEGCSDNRIECRKEIDKELKKFFTKTVLMWIFFFVITGIVSLGVFTGKISSKVSVNTQRIVDMHPNNRIGE